MESPYSPSRRRLALLLVSCLSAAALSPAQAQTAWRDTSGDHLWTNAANWSNGQPATGISVDFDGQGSEILLSSNLSAAYGFLNFTASNHSYTLRSNTPGTVRQLFAPAGGGSFRAAYEASNSSLTIQDVNISANAGSNFASNGSGNLLTLTGTGTRLAVAYNAGFNMGAGSGSIAANSGNSISVENGAALFAGVMNIGSKGANNSVTVTGTGSSLTITGLAGQANFHLNIGNASAEATNRLLLLNGANATVNYWNVNVIGGSLVVGKGSSLTQAHATRTDQMLNIYNRGTLYGAGTITTDILAATGAGATVHIGETASDYGLLTFIANGANSEASPGVFNGEWRNTNIELNLQIGNVTTTDGSERGLTYDFLDLSGTFAFGGSILIDLSDAFLAPEAELQLINWDATSGNLADLNVSFLDGSPYYSYEIRESGLFLTAVPEPGSMVLGALGCLAVLAGARRMRR